MGWARPGDTTDESKSIGLGSIGMGWARPGDTTDEYGLGDTFGIAQLEFYKVTLLNFSC
jgi:hypothetical protein